VYHKSFSFSVCHRDFSGDRVSITWEEARKGTISYGILQAHYTSGDPENLKIRFNAITSHDLTYAGIIQKARSFSVIILPEWRRACAPDRF